MSTESILQDALEVKQAMDELILLGDSAYVCMDCGVVTNWWKPGQVCYNCESEGERQMEQERGN
jgi:rubrerythrin